MNPISEDLPASLPLPEVPIHSLPRAAAAVSFIVQLISCRPYDDSRHFRAIRFPQDSTWLLVADTDTIRTYVDTASLQRSGQYVRAWIRIIDVHAEARAEVEPPFFTFETLQDIRCSPGLARGVAMRTPDEAGLPVTTPLVNQAWLPFDQHGLTSEILIPVCRGLARHGKPRNE